MRHAAQLHLLHFTAFQLTHLLRGATLRRLCGGYGQKFQLTHLLRGATISDPVGTAGVWFQLTHLLRGATRQQPDLCRVYTVSTHAPLARCDAHDIILHHVLGVSTHAPLARCDVRTPLLLPVSISFNSRTSCEVRPEPERKGCSPAGFNSRTSCEVRHAPHDFKAYTNVFQLTHLLRGATEGHREADQMGGFNSRTSCEVRRFRGADVVSCAPGFNSRTSCEVRRGAVCGCRDGMPGFNSRTSCEVRHRLRGFVPRLIVVSTHAPLARCDALRYAQRDYRNVSTHAPLARCDQVYVLLRSAMDVSTHAPLARCDTGCDVTASLRLSGFNSRTSCEVRRPGDRNGGQRNICFNSRTSCEVRRGADIFRQHAAGFNSRTSCEVRPPSQSKSPHCVSTHAPLARCDCLKRPIPAEVAEVSTHAPLARCDISRRCDAGNGGRFQLTHLLRGATPVHMIVPAIVPFQLTHLLRGATSSRSKLPRPLRRFNSRTSCEVRP